MTAAKIPPNAKIMSVHNLLSLNLRIPGYQRPYRWTAKNVSELLSDIDGAISEAREYPNFKYRIGSVILHKNTQDDCYDLVDGQQRVLSLVLLSLCLNSAERYPLLKRNSFSNRETQRNIKENHNFISDWIKYQTDPWRQSALAALSDTLEVVVIFVAEIEEAFQLFDSQNTRGRNLDPHDLLKAHHLRAMQHSPYEMRRMATQWEEHSPEDIGEIFTYYLYPILNWSLQKKTKQFTPREIDVYKGVPEKSGYTYAIRAMRAAPSFQIGAPFIEGRDFFLMTEHYLHMHNDIEMELSTNPEFRQIWKWLNKKSVSDGFKHASSLFRCAIFAYYDRFHNFDIRAVHKLFTWSFMLRVDMTSLGWDSVNKYAVGEANGKFTNALPMFSIIARARYHTDVANVTIRVETALKDFNEERRLLADFLASWTKEASR